MTTMWIKDIAPEYRVTLTDIDYLAGLLDIQTWPTVLDVTPVHDTAVERAAAHSSASRKLLDAGIMSRDACSTVGVTEPLADALAVLANPEAVVELRRYGVEVSPRMCLARSGGRHVVAHRRSDGLTIRMLGTVDASEVGPLIAAEFGPMSAADVQSISAPAAELRERLDRAATPADYADALYAVGATHTDAARYAAAFESCVGHAEIIAREAGPGRNLRTSGAVAVYDTARGRIVASPTVSPDGRIWTTLSAGTPHRVAQATDLLMETLPTGRWMP
ncbi:hypothetical protein ACVWY6_000737 [Williamsia sp. R60]